MTNHNRIIHLKGLMVLLLLAFAHIIASQPTGQPIAFNTLSTTTTQQKDHVDIESTKNTNHALHSIALSTTKYSNADFASYDATGHQISLIIGILDYSPRVFPPLVRMLSNLQEQSQKAMVKPLEILLVHIGHPETVEHSILSRLSQLFTSHLRYIGPDPPTAAIKLSVGLNRAAEQATGDILLFATDMLDDISISSIIQMAKTLSHPDIGIVAPKLLDSSKGGSIIFSTGLDFILGKNPHKPVWTNWYEIFATFKSIFVNHLY
jgi:hypothetical protein